MTLSRGEVRPGDRFGPYELVRLLAVGGMAEIYLARATGISGFEKFVALKVIHPNYSQDEHFIEMLVEEAKIAVHLTQPNIVQVFDLGRIGDVHYIAMEYVDGLDLYHIMRAITSEGEQVDLDVAVFIAMETCAALDYAHRCTDQMGQPLRIIHRDISPQNILLSGAGEVKLADFGIAKATVRARQTAVGVIKGKYYYMSPEQAWGDPIDHRTDLFSTGVVLYEVLVGQMLHLDEDLGVLLDKVRKCEIEPPSSLRPGLPQELERIVMKALSRRPEDRFQTAHDFQVALRRFLFTHSPSFSAGRLRALVERAVALTERSQAAEVAGMGASIETASLGGDALMDQREFVPLTTHSLLSLEVLTGEGTGPARLLPSYDDYDDDETIISDPPVMDHRDDPAPRLPVLASMHGVGAEQTGAGAGGSVGAAALAWDELQGSTSLLPGTQQGQTMPDRPLSRQQLGSASEGAASNPDEEQTVPLVGLEEMSRGVGRAEAALAAPVPGLLVEQAASPGPAAPGPAAPGPAAPGPPAFQEGWGGSPDVAEVEALEADLRRGQGQRLLILVGVLMCVVLLGVAIFILSSRALAAREGSVLLVTDPPGAKVFYRGKHVGDTPHRLDSLTREELHQVRLESDRCDPQVVKLPVEPGKVKTVRVKLRNCGSGRKKR